MPKVGYSTTTLPDWMINGLDELKETNDDYTDVIKKLLYKNLGKPRVTELYDNWIKKYRPLGGAKSL